MTRRSNTAIRGTAPPALNPVKGRDGPGTTMKPHNPVQLMKVDDVASMTGVPKGTLYNWRTSRYGPIGFRVGRHLRYDPADVRAWIDEQRSLAGVNR